MNPFGAFQSLGEVLGKKAVGALQTVFGTPTPTQRPVSTSGDSLDLSAGLQRLLNPVVDLFNPKTQAGTSVLNAADKITGTVLDSFGRNLSSSIDRLFGNADNPSDGSSANVVSTSTPMPSQNSLDIAAVLKALGTANPETKVTPDQIGQTSGINMTILIGGAALVALVLATRRS